MKCTKVDNHTSHIMILLNRYDGKLQIGSHGQNMKGALKQMGDIPQPEPRVGTKHISQRQEEAKIARPRM